MSELHKFIFEGMPVRGILVRLTEGWQEVLRRRQGQGSAAGAQFAEPVRGLLGEMAAAGVLMRANIKFNGALVLQFHGDGPVKLAVTRKANTPCRASTPCSCTIDEEVLELSLKLEIGDVTQQQRGDSQRRDRRAGLSTREAKRRSQRARVLDQRARLRVRASMLWPPPLVGDIVRTVQQRKDSANQE